MPAGLYAPMPRSPLTYLTVGINNSVTTIRVDDVSKLPSAPNIATIGDGEDSETIRYSGKSGDSLTGVTRGFEGAAREWSGGVQVANVPCAQHIRALQQRAVPSGCIVMWAGLRANIPSGWVLCDGTQGTPDLRDRFILGAAANKDPGAVGGAHTKTLSVSNIPAHTHSFSTGAENRSHSHAASVGNQSASHKHTITISSGGAHHHVGRAYGFTGIKPSTTGWFVLRRAISGDDYHGTAQITHTTGGAHSHPASSGNQSASHKHTVTLGNASRTHTHGGTTANTGSGSAIDIRPKYFKLAFIMKL